MSSKTNTTGEEDLLLAVESLAHARRLVPALSRGLRQFFREHLPKIEMEAEKLERFKRTILSDKELYVAFSDVQMRYK